MAIYHLSIKNISRASGQSALATLSYILSEKIHDDRLGKTYYGFGGSDRVIHTGMLSPDFIDPQLTTAQEVFNSLETVEHSNNARIAKNIDAALPRELTLDACISVTEQYIKQHFTSHGYPAAYAIHSDPDQHNPHVHILIANRPIDSKTGTWAKTKSKKEYALDSNGNRIPLIDSNTGKQKLDSRNRKMWKRVNVETNLMDKREFLQTLRNDWATECNQHLSLDQQIDPRSNADRGIDDIPTIHEGYVARDIHSNFIAGKRSTDSDLVQRNHEIRKHNSLIQQLKKELAELINNISSLITGETHERLRNLLQRARGTGADGSAGRQTSTDRSTKGDRAFERRKAREFIKQRSGITSGAETIPERGNYTDHKYEGSSRSQAIDGKGRAIKM